MFSSFFSQNGQDKKTKKPQMTTNAGTVFACGKSARTAGGSGAWWSHDENQYRSSLKARTRFTL